MKRRIFSLLSIATLLTILLFGGTDFNSEFSEKAFESATFTPIVESSTTDFGTANDPDLPIEH